MCEETDDGSKKKKSFFRKPDGGLWCATSMVLIYAVFCALVFLLAASGQLWKKQSLGCGLDTEFESRLENEAKLIYLWSGLNLVSCTLLVLEIWRRNSCWILMIMVSAAILVTMIWTFVDLHNKESQEIQMFLKPYLALLPFTETLIKTQNPPSNRHMLTKLNCWQTQFKCCGLESFQDWNNSFPDSCFYDEEHDNSWVGTNLFPRRNVYEKACIPTITSLVENRSSAVWIIMTVWLTIITAPYAIYFVGMVVGCFLMCYLSCEVSYKLSVLKYRICGGEKMVPVVFIRKNNNNQMKEEDTEAKESVLKEGDVLEDSDVLKEGDVLEDSDVLKEGDVLEDSDVLKEGVSLEGLDDNPVRMIPLSLLRKLQEELDPPPVQHQVQNSHLCLMHSSNAIRKFYTVLIEDDSPLLPSNAVLVDADKPTRTCWWEEGHKEFDVKDIVWPKDSLNRNSLC